ncbi:MAG: type I glyceraldehyde-3-phosphate dehydrogenase, partial [Desulfohalobiaceae bacterium]
ETSIEEVNDLLRRASESPEKKGILGVTTEPLVSSDIIGSPYSCVVALPFTNVIAGDMVKVLAWYDNEWGYCCRLMDLACEVG